MTGFAGAKLNIEGQDYLLVPVALCAAIPALPAAAALPPAILADLIDCKRSPIAVMRMHLGLTQLQLAEKIGVSRVAITQFEGGSGISADTLSALSACLGVPADLLLWRRPE